MKKVFYSLVAILAIGTACTKTELQDKPQGYTVKFELDQPQTKTYLNIDETAKLVTYNWDENETFAVLREATSLEKASSYTFKKENGKASIDAEFAGVEPNEAYYSVIYPESAFDDINSASTDVLALKLPSEQYPVSRSYDPNADLMYSEVQLFEKGKQLSPVRFHRVAAIGKFNIDGFAGKSINSVTFELPEYTIGSLVGSYIVDLFTEKYYIEDGMNKVVMSYATPLEVTDKAEVFFTCLPCTIPANTQYKITVVDSENKIWEKSGTFKDKIDFTSSDVRSFNVSGFTELTSYTWDMSTCLPEIATAEKMEWVSPLATVSVVKGSKATNAVNNYYPGNENRTSTRFYKGNPITLSSNSNVSYYKFVATTEGYATALLNATWTNAFAMLEGQTVIVVVTDKSKDVTCDLSATAGIEELTCSTEEYKVVVRQLSTPVVSCTTIAENSLTFSWNEVPNASGYKVSKGNDIWEEVNGLTYEWTGLTAGTEYTIYVKAIGNSDYFTDSEAAPCKATTSTASTTPGTITTLYTLDATLTTSQGVTGNGYNNDYTKTGFVTINNLKWMVDGNIQVSPWRIGGKSISNAQREIYTTSMFEKALKSVDITFGAATSITVNSCYLLYSTNADFTSATKIEKAFSANSTINFEADYPANCYYKLVLNVTVSATSNKFVELKKIEFKGLSN